MTLPIPRAATTHLDYFGLLVADDQQFALLEAAIAVALDEDPSLDPNRGRCLGLPAASPAEPLLLTGAGFRGQRQ